ncbi:unnamed protein product [Sphagnum jensenii]|uniref:Major facilitator superfamily (MFS) profile domain-containing protein n=1 Tax=Sphagnum jensenii TaxID=128206 RepID=A0ABP1B6U5_9BRYO
MAVHKEETALEKLNAVRPLFHLIVALTMQFVALSIVTPAIIGVIVEAVCPPGHAECGRVIFLSGFQQMSVGIGAMAMTPIIGSLSDSYGRKPLLTITCAANILPLALLAYRRDAAFVYAYFVMRIIIDAGDSGNTCVLLAAVADTVEDKLKGPAFGIILGSLAAGCLLGTSVAKGLSIDQVFKVAPMLAASAALYLTAFVRETNPCTAIVPALGDSPKQKWWRKLMNTKTSVVEAGRLVMNSKVLSNVAVIAFCSGVAEGTMSIGLMYYLKAAFNCGKDQFAVVLLITLIAQSLSQLVLLPVLLHMLGERIVLCIGLLGYGLQAFLYGIAWAPWVPYLAAFFGIFVVFVYPTIVTIVSKTAPPNEQGNIQGFISASKSFANIVTPLVMCPITALFLSDQAPFHFLGFSIFCASIPLLVAFFLCCFIGPLPPPLTSTKTNQYIVVPSDEVQDHAAYNVLP